jgi:hypothetical protein
MINFLLGDRTKSYTRKSVADKKEKTPAGDTGEPPPELRETLSYLRQDHR